jgi:hypothetical protein
MSFTLTNSCLVPVLLIWTVYFTEQAWFENEGGNFLPDGWWKFTDGHIAILESLAPTLVKQFHEGTHSGWTALKTTLALHFYVPRLSGISKTVCVRCDLCAKNNPQQGPRVPPQMQSVRGIPFEIWLWTLLRCWGPEDVNICWWLPAFSQDGWKPSLLGLKKPRKWFVKGNHPLVHNTCVYWIGQRGWPLWLRWYSWWLRA